MRNKAIYKFPKRHAFWMSFINSKEVASNRIAKSTFAFQVIENIARICTLLYLNDNLNVILCRFINDFINIVKVIRVFPFCQSSDKIDFHDIIRYFRDDDRIFAFINMALSI